MQTSRTMCLFRRERKILSCCLLRTYRYSRRLLTQYFVVGNNGVHPRWQSLDLKVSICIADRKEWIRNNVDECLHPRMIVAPYRNHQLGLTEDTRLCSAHWRLRNVNILVAADSRNHVNVMHRWIAISKANALSNHCSYDMRCITTAFLVDNDGGRRCWIHPVAQSIFHVDEDVLEAAIPTYILLAEVCCRKIAGRILCHIDLYRLRHLTRDMNGSTDCACGIPVNLRVCCGCIQ